MIDLNLSYNKNKLYKTLDYWSRDMLNFIFSEKSLGLVSPPHFMYDVSKKMSLMLNFINWPNFTVWLLLFLGILGNMSFLSRYLVCKNIYNMPSFMWSNDFFSRLKWWLYLYCIFLFNFFNIWSQLLKKIFFLEEMWNLFLQLAFKQYFAELIFPIDLSKTVFWGSNFCDFGTKSQK